MAAPSPYNLLSEKPTHAINSPSFLLSRLSELGRESILKNAIMATVIIDSISCLPRCRKFSYRLISPSLMKSVLMLHHLTRMKANYEKMQPIYEWFFRFCEIAHYDGSVRSVFLFFFFPSFSFFSLLSVPRPLPHFIIIIYYYYIIKIDSNISCDVQSMHRFWPCLRGCPGKRRKKKKSAEKTERGRKGNGEENE